MGELERRSGFSGLMNTKAERDALRDIERVMLEARRSGAEIDAAAAVTARAMERTVDVDGYRKLLAGGDPVLNAVLAGFEMQFVAKARNIQMDLGL